MASNSTTKKPAEQKRHGRPRSLEAREAILQATNELLEESGFGNLSIEGIAQRAGVGKTTIYRWWPTKGAVAIEGFLTSVAPKIAFPETESAATDIEVQILRVTSLYRGRIGRLVTELMALGQSDPETMRLFVQGYLIPRRKETRRVLLRGIENGEFRKDLDLEIVMDALYGPLFYRMITQYAPLDEKSIRGAIRLVLRSISCR